MKPDIKPRSPFVGLIPYTDSDAEFFFGRESETDIISANLRAARLTVLYGSSGVGKSSVLQAGVIHKLRAIAKEDINTYGQTDFAIVIFRKWAGDPIKDFAKAIHQAIADSLGIDSELLEKVPVTRNLTEMLRAWSQRYNLELLIILDQFEELFNYLGEKDSPVCRGCKGLGSIRAIPYLFAGRHFRCWTFLRKLFPGGSITACRYTI
jgi:hypothetical protein